MKCIKDLIAISKKEILLNKEDYNFKTQLNLVNTIESNIEKNENILWYPSSFSDFDDLLYFNNDRLDILGEHDPILYIHTDILSKQDIGFLPEQNFFNSYGGSSTYSITIPIPTNSEYQYKSITLSYFSLGSRKPKYKINLFGFSNNEILDMFIYSNIHVKYLYTTFTNEQLESNIEPHYYFHFYNVLQTKFHIGICLEDFRDMEKQNSKIMRFLKSQKNEIQEKVLPNLTETKEDILYKYRIEKINKDGKIRFLGNYIEGLKCRFI